MPASLPKLNRRLWLTLATCGMFLFPAIYLTAATITWRDTGSDFATGSDWVGFVAPANSITTDIASFGLVSNFQPNLASARSITGLVFTAASTNAVTFTGARFTIGTSGINNQSTTGLKFINNAITLGAAQSFTNSGALTVDGNITNAGLLLTLAGTGASGTVSGDISGNGGLTKSGAGTWIVSGNNSYVGTTTVSAGTLGATSNANALGNGALSLNGGTLQLANNSGLNFGNNTTVAVNSTIVSDVLTNGNAGVNHTLGTLSQGTFTLGVNAGGNVGSGVAGVTFGAATITGNATFNVGSGAQLTLGAIASNSSTARTLTKTGAGDLFLNAAMTGTWKSGSALTINNGTVRLGADDALGATALTNVTVNSNVAGGTALFDLNGHDQTVLSLTFGGAGGTSSSTSNVDTGAGTLTLGGNVTFTNTGNPLGSTLSGHVDLGGGTRTFAIGDSSAPIDLAVTADIANSSGTAGLTKSGAGTLQLSGNNTFTGITTLSAGTLLATNNASALGAGALTLTAGTLQLANDSGLNFGNNTTLGGTVAVVSDVLTYGNAGVTHTLGTLITGSNTLTLTAGGNVGSGTAGLTFGATSISGNATFNTGAGTQLTLGALSDTAARTITKSGAGTLLLNSAAGTWTNASTLNITNGTVQLGADNALGSGAILTNITVNATIAGTTALFDLNGHDQRILALTFGGATATATSANNVDTGGGTLTLGGNVTYTSTNSPLGSTLSGLVDLGSATRTFTIGDSLNAAFDLTVSANISSNSGAFGITKAGAGTLLLNGNNSYTGITTVSTGALNIQSNNALGAAGGSTSVTSGAALQLQNNVTVTGERLTLNGAGVGSANGALRNISDNNTWTGNITLGAASQVQSDSGLLTLSGNITGATRTLTVAGSGDTEISGAIGTTTGGLIKNGTGSLTLSGASANTNTGATTINAGTVNLNKTAGVNALGTGAITVGDGTGGANSANLVLQANHQLANTAAITLNSDGRLALNTFTDAINTIAGTGLVDLGSTGSLTLGANNGSSTFGGSVTGAGELIKAGSGTFTFNSNLNFTGTLTINSGVVALNGFDLTVGTLHITGNCTLDFGNSAASTLTAANFIVDTGVTLTVSNWVNLVDYFNVMNNPGGSSGSPPLNQVLFTGGGYTSDDTKWLSYDHQITPAPEPAIYGAVLAGLSTLLLAWRRRRAIQS